MKPRLSLSSVRVRLALWNVGVLAFVLVGLGIIFSVTIQANISAAVNRRLDQKAHHAEHYFDDHVFNSNQPPPPRDDDASEHPPAAGQRPPPHEDGPSVGPFDDLRPRLFTSDGQAVPPPDDTPNQPLDTPWDALGLRRAQAGEEVYSTVHVDGSDMRVLSLPIQHDGQTVGVVQAANSMTHIYEERARMTKILVYLIPVVLLIAGLGGAFLTDRALRPVRQIASAAGRIEAEDLSKRLPVTGDDEFADLADTINGMLSRLQAGFARQEEAFEQQKRFAADASHELRTPLTIIKANTSLALSERRTGTEYEKTLRAVDTAADRMTRIVQDLLLLARADADQLGYPLVPVPLAEVLVLAAGSIPGSENAPITLNLPEKPLLALGHADSLTRLFGNLLENAARHTPSDGRITVAAHRVENQIVVEVNDTGVGIAPEHLPHVTERFYRVEAARSRAHGGTGLGLSICRSIVEAHGGSLAVESVLGQGTTVRVALLSAEGRTGMEHSTTDTLKAAERSARSEEVNFSR